MNKIFLALAILGAGTTGFVTTRHSTVRLQREASNTRESWNVQTELLSEAESERTRLAERIRELKQNLRQAEAAGNQNAVWSVLATNRTGDLAPDLREHVLEELGFDWQSSEDFVVVSKKTIRDVQIRPIEEGKLTENAATVLAVTTTERDEIEAAMRRAEAELDQWALSHTERIEPKDDVVAQYTLQNDPAMSASNNFSASLLKAVGPQRAELIRHSAWEWMRRIGVLEGSRTMTVRRSVAENGQRLTFQMLCVGEKSAVVGPVDISKLPFPRLFLPVFPNGWADVARREGFELPKELQEK